MNIHFYKYHGAGNDFIIIDNRSRVLDMIKDTHTIAALCHRRFGIGADGLMLLEHNLETDVKTELPHPLFESGADSNADFNMVYYNADGGLGSMCGNGGRCIVALAYRLGIIGSATTFNAADGKHDAKLVSPDYVELKINPVHNIDLFTDHAVLDTGSPHYIQVVEDILNYPVFDKGQSIRYSGEFPKGINVNYIEPNADDLNIRTYERGVEDETWACGTGAVAAALAYIEMSQKYNLHEIQLEAKGGRLKVKFDRTSPGHFENIWLCGGATFIYEGNFTL
ncbi:MAG: diaminopimelate epimerase [Saprospiraceae bacterium]